MIIGGIGTAESIGIPRIESYEIPSIAESITLGTAQLETPSGKVYGFVFALSVLVFLGWILKKGD